MSDFFKHINSGYGEILLNMNASSNSEQMIKPKETKSILRYFDNIGRGNYKLIPQMEDFKRTAYKIYDGCPNDIRPDWFIDSLISSLLKTLSEYEPIIQVPESEEMEVCKLKLNQVLRLFLWNHKDEALRLLLEARDCYIRYCEG